MTRNRGSYVHEHGRPGNSPNPHGKNNLIVRGFLVTKRLMLAVLQEAIVDVEENVSAKNGRRKSLFREAKEWIFDEAKDRIFFF
jgi:hypothetical protein